MAKTSHHYCHLSQTAFIPLSFSSSLIPMQRHTHAHTQNTPLYLQKARGRQSAWINSLSAYISIPAYPTANKTQFTVNELLRHSWGSLTVTLHSTPITNSRKKSTHTLTHIKKCDYKRHSVVLQHSPVFYQNKTGIPYPSRQFEACTYMRIVSRKTWLPSTHLEVTSIRRLGKVSNHHLDIWRWNYPVKLIIVVRRAGEGDSHTWRHMDYVCVCVYLNFSCCGDIHLFTQLHCLFLGQRVTC